MDLKEEKMPLLPTHHIDTNKRIEPKDSIDDLPQVDHPKENPFVYDCPMTFYERMKIGIMCICLIPVIRIILLFILMLPILFLGCLGTLGHQSQDSVTKRSIPLSKWRRILIYPIRWFLRMMLFVLGFYWISIKYPKNNSKSTLSNAKILIANHITFIDGIFFAAHCFPSVAMRGDLGNIPIIGRVIRCFDPILIDRKTSEGRKTALEEIRQRPKSSNFPNLLIFPEGTTSSSKYLTQFKRGAFTPGVSVQPIIIKYPYRHFDLSWSPSVSPGYLFARLLCQFYVPMEVEYLPIYEPNPMEMQNPQLFAENVRQRMAKALHVTCTNHAFEDVLLFSQIGQYASHVVAKTDVKEIQTLTNMKSNEIQKLIRRFSHLDTNQDGTISLMEMCQILECDQESEFIYHLFDLLDNDGNGQIDFRELCLGLSALSPNIPRDEMLQFAFSMYDQDNSGQISPLELRNVLQLSRQLTGSLMDDIDQIVARFDTDGNGMISFEEFKRLADDQPEIIDHVMEKMKPLTTTDSNISCSSK